jgi:phosphatidylglycerol:prolipoprotein diacylglycerol transferase
MHPILFNLGKITVFSYGFFVALAFIASILYLSHSLAKSKEKVILQDELYSLSLYIAIFGIIGSRILFVIINSQEFLLYPLNIFKLWRGGLVYYGGFMAAMIFSIIYTKKKTYRCFNWEIFLLRH